MSKLPFIPARKLRFSLKTKGSAARGNLFRTLLGATALLFAALPGQAEPSAPKIVAPEGDPFISEEGAFSIEWIVEGTEGADAALEYEIQRATATDFSDVRTIYRGGDTATFVSGLPESILQYRVRSFDPQGNPSAWSEPLKVEVRYVSMALVTGILIAGGLTFLATVYFIVIGHRRASSGLDKASEP